MNDANTSISNFLTAASAKQPTPGGGAVSALTGALAASMGEMVLAYSVSKKDLIPFSEKNQQALHELSNARRVMLELMVEDQQAYLAFSEAKKAGLPPEQMKPIVDACVGVPHAIATIGLTILKIANRIAGTSNKWLHSDLAVCGELAIATVRCAIHNVRVNLPELPAEEQARFVADCQRLTTQAVEEITKLIKSL